MKSLTTTLIVLFGIAFFVPTTKAQNNLQGNNPMNNQIVQNFVRAINEHNVDKLCSLMTDDHTFIDSQGNKMAGKEQMSAGWIGYFHMFPDYKIEITELFLKGDTVAAFGFAGGTFKGLSDKKENYWHLPASWKAVITNGKVQLWQVYADSKIPFDIVSKNKN
jgi:ketosteroid isomerase-like protein